MKYNVKIRYEFEIDEIKARDERDAVHKFNAQIVHDACLYGNVHQRHGHPLFVKEICEVAE